METKNTDKLERSTEKRTNLEWIEKELHKAGSVFIPSYNSKYLFQISGNTGAVFLTRETIDNENIKFENYIFLGQANGASYFTIEIDDKASKQLEKYGVFQELRKSIPFLSQFQINIMLHARAMSYWHSRHKFCGTCGSLTINREAGNLLVCSDKNCNQSHFPRTDPAVIVLVTKDDKCLLGHNKGWPGNRYSTLAGFVEPGESLEDAVKREVFEESGIEVKNIKYFSSQPWPFPSSLMLGFTAEAINENILIDDYEIEDAAWFTREEIVDKLGNGKIKMPTKISIAFKLVSNWFDKGGCGKLSDITNDD